MKVLREIRLWIPIILLLVVGYKAYVMIKNLKAELVRARLETVVVEKEVLVPQIVEKIKWRDRIIFKEVQPETVVVDTTVRIDTFFQYSRPWGIYELGKKDRKLDFTAGRSIGSGLMAFRQEKYKLRTGKEFKIYPRPDSLNPFFLKEARDLFDIEIVTGYDSDEKIFAEIGLLVNRIWIGDIDFYLRSGFVSQSIGIKYRIGK